MVKIYRSRLTKWFDNWLDTPQAVMAVLDEFHRLSEGDEDRRREERRRTQARQMENGVLRREVELDGEENLGDAGGLPRMGQDEHGDRIELQVVQVGPEK
jgi:hypothetical protein